MVRNDGIYAGVSLFKGITVLDGLDCEVKCLGDKLGDKLEVGAKVPWRFAPKWRPPRSVSEPMACTGFCLPSKRGGFSWMAS